MHTCTSTSLCVWVCVYGTVSLQWYKYQLLLIRYAFRLSVCVCVCVAFHSCIPAVLWVCWSMFQLYVSVSVCVWVKLVCSCFPIAFHSPHFSSPSHCFLSLSLSVCLSLSPFFSLISSAEQLWKCLFVCAHVSLCVCVYVLKYVCVFLCLCLRERVRCVCVCVYVCDCVFHPTDTGKLFYSLSRLNKDSHPPLAWLTLCGCVCGCVCVCV